VNSIDRAAHGQSSIQCTVTATPVLANFRQLSGERAVKIHPLVARLADAEILEKMNAHPVGVEAGAGQGAMSEPRGNA
jgi:hypothetical protein